MSTVEVNDVFRTTAGNFYMPSVNTSVSLQTIYRVPDRIQQANEGAFKAYGPQVVTIGPYYHHEEFERHKERYQKSILFRNRNHVLEDYHTAIVENEARSCYSGYVHPKGNEFVKMMVLDGCFIVELFLREKEKKENKEKKPENEQSEEDPIFSTIWMLPLIRYDMLLLENQIPFSVLKVIYEKASGGNGSLVELALDFFKPIIPNHEENEIKVSDHQINFNYFHLLHLFHSYLCPKGSNEANETKLTINNSRPIKMIPCVTELQLAGVKFKKKKDFSSFLDVKFSGGVLEIPYFCIDDHTNTLLRNLVALEQFCYPKVKTIHFTNYVGFMDCLINTSKDVALLHRKGIIDHLLGSDGHVADLFNQLCYGIFNDFEDHNYLSGIYKDVDKYYNNPWKTRLANLKSDYFTNPWASLSSAAAVILILLTFLQTFYAIFAYHRPGS
ncbi:UPF0481 protein At3g47200-like [Magnolia sinica]|uniref:UPF0481 protein At3g47200-like n=1 Tax=Magnolia sinica TaxID=86752 RepID=UPI00265A829E|nr:UPF0481 protein At3g47200-like [Magnolia sinica]